jgi:SNF family Na+-dependent transporter
VKLAVGRRFLFTVFFSLLLFLSFTFQSSLLNSACAVCNDHVATMRKRGKTAERAMAVGKGVRAVESAGAKVAPLAAPQISAPSQFVR